MWLADVSRDIRQALRSLTTAPGFAAGVILSLTLGIVANTVAFSFINAVVFRPFPGVRDQDALVRVTVSRPDGRSTYIASTYAEYEALAAGLPALTGLSAYLRTELALTVDRQSSAVPAALVSRNYFDVVGTTPASGRFFAPTDDARDAATPVAVISHELWRRHFRQEPSAIGRTVLINGASVTIVGVTPPEFHGVEKGHFDIGVWLPADLGHLTFRDDARRPVSVTAAGFRSFRYVGRRQPAIPMAAVVAQAAALAPAIDLGRPPNRRGVRVDAGRVWLNDPAQYAPAIVGFMVAPLLVLVLACVNAGNLLLARSSRQRREWEVRLALGASRWRVVRQVLVESVILAGIAAGAGLLLTAWVMKVLAGMVPVRMPIDVRVQVFTLAITLLAAFAFGFGPALRVARSGMSALGNLRTGYGQARSPLRATLIALQAALSLGLLATGAQFLQTVRTTIGATGVHGADRLMIAGFNVEALNMEPPAAADFYGRLVERIRDADGVLAAGVSTLSTRGTFGDANSLYWWRPADAPPDGRGGLGVAVSGRYFEAVHASLIAGRYFTPADETVTPRTAIVSDALARRYFPQGAVGATLRVAATTARQRTRDVEIVGIVGPPLGEKREVPIVYLPAPLTDSPARSLYVRFDDSGRFTIASLQQAVSAVDFRVPIRDAGLLSEQRGDSDRERELLAGGVAGLGIFALALAAGGLYGVVSYVVALRRREIGIRLALGATTQSVVGLILRQGLVPAAVGAALGAGTAAAIGIIVRSRLHGVSPVDPMAFAGATAVLLLALSGASIIPARHAARVDPATTLRTE